MSKRISPRSLSVVGFSLFLVLASSAIIPSLASHNDIVQPATECENNFVMADAYAHDDDNDGVTVRVYIEYQGVPDGDQFEETSVNGAAEEHLEQVGTFTYVEATAYAKNSRETKTSSCTKGVKVT